MIGLLVASSNLPPWMRGASVLYAGLYGYGAVEYEERAVNVASYSSSYLAKGLSSSTSHFGGGAFIRWNTWGVNLDLREGYFYKWQPSYQDTTFPDTSFFQNIEVTLAHYINPYSWTYVGFTVSNRRFAFGYGIPFPDTSDSLVKNSVNLPVPNVNIKYMSMGISGRVYLELESLFSEGRGFLPWAGGHVAWSQISFQSFDDPLGDASGTGSTINFDLYLGLDFYVAPWLGFFVQGSYSSFDSGFPIANLNPGYRDYYDQIKVGYNNTSVKAGLRLTWSKERY